MSSWLPYRPGPPLALGEVHVARLSMGAAEPFLPALHRILSDDELDRAAAFRFAKDRDCYVAVRGGLRVILARYLDAQPQALRFRVNRFGKPLLADPPSDGIRFNVSHSGSLALFAFARGGRIGVDVELIRDDVPHLAMAGRFFSTAEQHAFRSSRRQVDLFFETWTRKEAYMKGRGQGFTIPPNEFSVAPDDDAPVDDESCNSRPGSWRTLRIEVAEGYAAAVAVEGGDWLVRCFEAVDVLDG